MVVAQPPQVLPWIALERLVEDVDEDHALATPLAGGEAVEKALGTEPVVLHGRGHAVSMAAPDAVADLIEAHAVATDG